MNKTTSLILSDLLSFNIKLYNKEYSNKIFYTNSLTRLGVIFLFLFLSFNNQIGAQIIQFNKSVSNTTPNEGEIFDFSLELSCQGSVGNCEDVTISDFLPESVEFLNFSSPLPTGVSAANYNPATREITVSFDSNNVSAGSSLQLLVQVRFPIGSFNGTQAVNTANAYSRNNNLSSTATATVQSSNNPQAGCAQLPNEVSSDGVILSPGGGTFYAEIGNIGFDDIDDWTYTASVPNNSTLEWVRTPVFPGVSHIGELFYQSTLNPGVWVLWDDFNLNSQKHRNVSGIGLPAGESVTDIKIELGTIPGNGLYNFNIYPDGYGRRLKLYAVVDAGLPVGSNIQYCGYYSGTINGLNCTGSDCTTNNVISPSNVITGGKYISDLDYVEQTSYNINDTVLVHVDFASPVTMGFDVVGAVMTDVLPAGMSIVPGSDAFEWGQDNADNMDYVLESGTLFDGRQYMRFVFDDSHGNEFTIEPDGTWEGFSIEFKAVINPGMAQGWHTNNFYFNATGSSHNNCLLNDVENYNNGYASTYCHDEYSFEIVYAPSSAGLQSKKEVKGSKDANYSSYPAFGTTVPGGLNDYRIELTNPNSTPINNITLIDVFPYSGDTEILDGSTSRFSQWKPNFLEPITAPNGSTVYYTTVNNPCRDELASASDPLPYFPSGCNAANWSTSPPSDITTVTGFKIDLGSTTLNQNDTYTLEWEMRVPVNAPTSGEIAWNSFAYTASNANTNSRLLPAEPVKVGIQSLTGTIPFLGDKVWRDTNGNGVQDPGEPGQDGVTVTLFRDNGNGNQDGADTEVATTVTANGGLYLFSEFPFGDYYVEFSNLPSGYNETHTNIGSESEDSDGLITEILTYGISSDNRDVDLGIYPGTPPSLCDLRVTIDSDSKCGAFNINGGFEDSGSIVFNTSYQGIDAALITDGEIPNWVLATGSGGPQNTYYIDDNLNQVNNPDGNKFVMINTEGYCLLNTTNLTAGTCYEINFWAAFHNTNGTQTDIVLEFADNSTNNTVTPFFSETLTASSDFNNMTWYNISTTFTPSVSDGVRLYFTFTNLSGINTGGIAIDDFHYSECCLDLCTGDSHLLKPIVTNGTKPLNYLWSTGATSTNLNISPATSTTYSVTVTDSNNCKVSTEIDVNVSTCEVCDNGIDDDGDGDTDCADSECGFIDNHDFDYSTTEWTHWFNSPLSSTFTIDNSSQLNGINSAQISVSGSTGNAIDVQFAQLNKSIEAGKTYVIEFEARAATNRTIQAAIDLGISPWTNFFNETVSLTTSAQSYSYSFTSNSTVIGDARVMFNLGEEDGTVWLDNIKFYEACNCNANINLNYTIGSCIDQPLEDIAIMEVTATWNNRPGYDNDLLIVKIGNDIRTINVAAGITSPQLLTFNIRANGINNDDIEAYWYNWEDCGRFDDTFNHPDPCSNDEIICDILYLCGLDKAFDGDAWDHGFIEYLLDNNGSNTLLPILTKNESGLGTYDPMNPNTFINVDFDDYDLIVISATTEGHISSDLIDAIRNFRGGILLSNYLLQDDLGYTNTSNEGVIWGNDAFINDTQSETILTYNNINPWSSYLMTHGDYLPSANSDLWASAGNASTNQNGIIYNYKSKDILPGVAIHGPRAYLGYHMNGIYGNDQNNGVIPSDPNGWFDPVIHLSAVGKELFDKAILNAGAGCFPEICDNGTDDDGDGFIDCADATCATNPECNTCTNLGPNLIQNGDFEQGYFGFTSDLGRGMQNTTSIGCSIQGYFNVGPCAGNGFCSDHSYPGNSSLYGAPGTYTPNDPLNINNQVATSCSNSSSCDGNFPDHTSGNGNVLFVDPDSRVGTAYWKQTIDICPNTEYIFSAWVWSRDSPPAEFYFRVGNEAINETTVYPNINQWVEAKSVWNSGSNSGPMEIALINTVSGCKGNDVYIDDIYFGTCNKELALQSDFSSFCPNGSVTLSPSTETTSSGWNYFELFENGTIVQSGTSISYNTSTIGEYVLYGFTTPNNSGCVSISEPLIIDIDPSSDVIAYCCDDNSGAISGDQSICGTCVDPDEISSSSAPTGGAGNIEYVWMESTSTCLAPTSINDPNWTIISGANSETYNPTEINCNTCYVRLSRRQDCSDYLITNVISINIERVIFTNRFIRYNR